MLDAHLKSPVTRRRLRSGPVAAHVDGFADWLHRRGHPSAILKKRLQSLACWADWLRSTKRAETDFVGGLTACEAHIKDHPRIHYQRGPNRDSIAAARLFVLFLREQHLLPPYVPPSSSDLWPLLAEFRLWMRSHRGVTESTLNIYDGSLSELLATIGTDPGAYTAETIRGFVLARASRHGPSYAKLTATAVRTFLRFLAATARCPAGMEHSLPAFASWKHSSLPRFLVPEDLERVIASRTSGALALRDTAILLLLARLGLRAGDVVKLKLSDIDWQNGTLAVCGKGRRRDLLPMPQEVGDAILNYLKRARPPLRVQEVFTTVTTPIRPLSTQTVASTVRRALCRAGVKAPTQGAHLLRHSAATSMLRQGASLAGVGAILRHRSPQTTAHYAKVDVDLLSEIAQPWPGAASC